MEPCPHSDGNACEQYRLQEMRCQSCPLLEENLQAMVHFALNNATANGFDMLMWKDDDIIADLQDYDAECARIPPHRLRPHILTWKQANGTRKA